MYSLFNKKNVIVFIVVILVLVLVNSFALNNNDFSINLKYENTKGRSLYVHSEVDESMNSDGEKIVLILEYDIKNIRGDGYSPNDIMIKISGLGNIREDQMKVIIDKDIATYKNTSSKDALFTYYYNKSSNQYIFMNNKYIKDYMKGEIRLTFNIDKNAIVRDYKNILTASLSAPNMKVGSSELVYEEKK